MPLLGPKSLASRQYCLYGRVLEIHRRGNHVVAPPRRRVNIVQGKREEDDQGAQRETQIETGAGQKVQSAPPAEVALLDQVLEYEAHDAPGQVVERRGRRYGPGPAKNDGGNQVLNGRLGPTPGAVVEEHREDGADAEEDEEARVNLAGGEHAGWA